MDDGGFGGMSDTELLLLESPNRPVNRSNGDDDDPSGAMYTFVVVVVIDVFIVLPPDDV